MTFRNKYQINSKRPHSFKKQFNPNKKRKFNNDHIIKNNAKNTNLIEKTSEIEAASSTDSESDTEELKRNSVSQLLSTFSDHESTDEEESAEEEESEEEKEGEELEDEDEEEIEDLNEEDEIENDNNSDNKGSDSEIDEQDDVENISVQSPAEESEEETNEEDETQNFECGVFHKHFERNLNDYAAEHIKQSTNWTSTFFNCKNLGRLKFEMPSPLKPLSKSSLLLSEDEILPDLGSDLSSVEESAIENANVKSQILKNIPYANEDSSFNEEQLEMFNILNNYVDFYRPNTSFNKWDLIRPVYCLHALNHILKTRNRVMHHNTKINKAKKAKKFEESDTYRDQGYCRPKVLILLPFRHTAYRVVNTMIQLLYPKSGDCVQNKNRFIEDFGPNMEEKTPKNKPEDFLETFKGDIREDFQIGLTITKKSLKLYTEFSQSDIIIASPLGLRVTIFGDEQTAASDSDILSSIEMLIMDQADVFMMQNWEHVMIIMDRINQPPNDVHKLSTDLTRVRLWSLNGFSPLYRQTIIFSDTIIDNQRGIFRKCLNFAGKVQTLNPIETGSIKSVIVNSELILMKVPSRSDRDIRFNHFLKEVLPQFRTTSKANTLIYVPDYCDYLRIVKYLMEDGGISYSTINEYMVGKNANVAKARTNFYEGKKHLLIYTERFHFYRRYIIKGIHHILFYSPPTYPHYFSELCNFMMENYQNSRLKRNKIGKQSVTVMYQTSDLSKMVGILGSQHATDIIKSDNSIHIAEMG